MMHFDPEQSIHLSDLAEDFYMDLRLRNRAVGTVRMYRFLLEKFLVYLDNEGIRHPLQITREIVKGYQLALYTGRQSSERMGSSWVNQYLVPVKCFLRFFKERSILGNDPADGIQYSKSSRRLPRVILSAKEMVTLIEAPDITAVIGYRDRTIMEVLYSTGIRRSECMGITIPAVDFHEGLLRILGKGRKERMVPLGRIALEFLRRYVRDVRPLLKPASHEDHVFLTYRGHKLGRDVIGELIKRYVRQTGLGKRVTPHTFRHTCATLMLRNRADIRHIQELLGHSSLETTQIYTHVAMTDLKDVLARYHPRERDHRL